MRKGKKTMLLLLALSLSLGLAAAGWAGGPMGMGGGMGGANLTPEQASALFDLKEKMHADTAGLRKQMMVKRAELGALWKAENPDQNAILAKQKEINALREQMQQKMVAFRLEAKKIAPNATFGRGMGHGMGGGCGPGGGMGPGMAPPAPPEK